MSASQELNKARAAFMRRASAPSLPASALKLAYLIAFKHMDCRTESTWRVRQETLAADLNAEVRTVQNLLAILAPLGLMIEPGHGPGKTNTYRIVDPEKAKPVSPLKAKSNPRKGEIERREKAKPISPPLNKTLQSLSLPGEREEREVDLSGGVRLEAAPPPPVNEKKDKKDVDGEFREFWNPYPKHTGEDGARREFTRLVNEEGINSRDIIAGAKRYADERAGQSPRFTMAPVKWLRDGHWKDEPSSSNGVAVNGHAPRRSKTATAIDKILALAMQRQAEGD
jgi:hypothetical protein